MTATESLGGHIAALHYDRIPADVLEKLKTCLLYGLAMAATAGRDEILDRAVHDVCDAPGPARILVSGQARAAADAAYANAFRMCARGQNDTYSEIYAHPGCIVIPVVLALAEQCAATGRDVLAAMAAGYETLYAVAAGYAEAVVQRRFRATSVFGVFAAAAAAARLLRLDARQAAHALALASQHSGGTMQCWVEGTPEWRIQVAQAARAGIGCARLAAGGYPAAGAALEGESGLYRSFAGMAPREDPLALPSWATPRVTFKPLPGCLINQAPLYLLLALRRRHGFDAAAVDRIDVELSVRNAAYPGIDRHGPFETATGAVMSCAFMLAVGLRDGTLRMADFAAMHAEGDIHDLGRCIHVHADAALPDWGARVRVRLRDGRLYEDAMTELSRFSFDWNEADAILSGMAQEWPWPDAAARYGRVRSRIRELEHSDSVREIIAAVCP